MYLDLLWQIDSNWFELFFFKFNVTSNIDECLMKHNLHATIYFNVALALQVVYFKLENYDSTIYHVIV